MNKIFILFFVLISFNNQALSQNLQYYYKQAKDAYQQGDHQKFYEMIIEASNLHPYNQTILYNRGIAATLNNKPDEAIKYLREAILINSEFDLTISDLQSLANLKEFKLLKDLQQQLASPIIQSDTALLIKDRTLHAETIAAGEKKGVFYLSSVHKRKVVRINEYGQEVDFTTAQDGLTAVLGLKVDRKKKYLWVCSSPMEEMQNFDTVSQSAVLKYDIQSKKLLQKFTIEKESVFGDLIINKTGDVFISDSKNNIIYKANESSGKLDTYFTSPEFWNIQGITFSDDEQFLFIADYIKGIFRLNTKTMELIQLKRTPEISLKSVDGLIWYKNALIAIQNGVTPMRATQYFLNSSLDTISDYKIIDRAHPAFNEPTNGCIIGDTLYYVANSQWSGYDDQHHPKPTNQLQDIVILKYSLVK